MLLQSTFRIWSIPFIMEHRPDIVHCTFSLEAVSKPIFAIISMAGNLRTYVSERSNSHAYVPVSVAPTTAAEHDRVQDGPNAFFNRCSVEFD